MSCWHLKMLGLIGLILGHPSHGGLKLVPPWPPPPSWVTVYCTTAYCMKKPFFIISLKLPESSFCNQRFDIQNKNALETPFLSRFSIFCYFLNLNQDFREELQCKICVQLPILWKTQFFQNRLAHILAMWLMILALISVCWGWGVGKGGGGLGLVKGWPRIKRFLWGWGGLYKMYRSSIKFISRSKKLKPKI